MATKKEVVKKQTTEIMVGDLGSLEDFAGQGTENVGIQDIKLPEIKCASKTTPEVDEDNPKYIEGCKIGDIFNNATKSVYEGYKRENKGVLAVPCHYYLNWVEWSKLGTGNVAPENVYSDNSILAQTSRKPASEKDYKDYLPNGNYVAETANHFVLLLDEDYQPMEQGLIRMAATQRKKSKLWNTMITSKKMKSKKGGFFTPASWAGVYRLTTCQEQNDMGPWTGWVINFDRMLDQPGDEKTLQAAHKFCQDAKDFDMSSNATNETAAEPIVVEDKKADADFEDGKVPF
tara:strand:- start:6617 stop:7483 length:867 start_codon:yes stop_codon:yes gene_type:complete